MNLSATIDADALQYGSPYVPPTWILSRHCAPAAFLIYKSASMDTSGTHRLECGDYSASGGNFLRMLTGRPKFHLDSLSPSQSLLPNSSRMSGEIAVTRSWESCISHLGFSGHPPNGTPCLSVRRFRTTTYGRPRLQECFNTVGGSFLWANAAFVVDVRGDTALTALPAPSQAVLGFISTLMCFLPRAFRRHLPRPAGFGRSMPT